MIRIDVDELSFSSVPLLFGVKYFFIPGSWFLWDWRIWV